MAYTIYHLLNGGPLHLLSSCLSPSMLACPPGLDLAHRVIVWGGDPGRVRDRLRQDAIALTADQCGFVPEGLRSLVPRLREVADEGGSLIIHGVYNRWFWFGLRRVPQLLARTAWISWGGGVISPWRHYPIGLNPLRYLWFRPYRYCVPRLAAVSCQTDQEFEMLQTMVGPLSTRCLARYPHPGLPERFQLRQPRSPLKVCVGHRARAVAEYEFAFEQLARFSDRQLEVHVLLSTGDAGMADAITALGGRMLGRAFHPVRELMSLPDYLEFLRDMDVLIMPQYYAVGGFSCTYSLCCGTKLFLRPENTYLQRKREDGCHLFELDALTELCYEELAQPMPEAAQQANYHSVWSHNELVCSLWEKLYRSLATSGRLQE